MSNVPESIAKVNSNMDEEAVVRASLPERLRKILDEDAPVPFMPSQVAAFVAAHGEEAAVKRMREIVAADTKKVYGADHPALREK